MITPQDFSFDDVAVVHGAHFMQRWPLPTDNTTELPRWWPAVKTKPASIQLIITDWDEGDLDVMVRDLS